MDIKKRKTKGHPPKGPRSPPDESNSWRRPSANKQKSWGEWPGFEKNPSWKRLHPKKGGLTTPTGTGMGEDEFTFLLAKKKKEEWDSLKNPSRRAQVRLEVRPSLVRLGKEMESFYPIH